VLVGAASYDDRVTWADYWDLANLLGRFASLWVLALHHREDP
jgi:hypothetical protein